MKRTIFFSFVFLLVGVFGTSLVLLNPFHWEWLHGLQSSVMVWMHPDFSPAEQGVEGQLWTCGMHPQVVQDRPGNCPICGMKLVPLNASGGEESPSSGTQGERRILYWQAPMDPTYISDQPGKSPMGMDLVPVYEGEEEAPQPGIVKIDPGFVQNIGVQTMAVKRTDIPFTVRTIGTLTYNEGQLYWVNTRFDGWIEKVYVNYVGESVEKGQKLFEIYSPQLVTTQQEYLQALDYAERLGGSGKPEIEERARTLLESTRKRLEYWDITDEQVRELEKTRTVKRTLAVTSPVAGMVVKKMDQALEGMYARSGMNLYQLVDLSSIWVEAEIFENQIPWLKVGQRARVEIPYQPGRSYWGTIRYVYPYFNEKTRTMKVSLELPNPDGELRSDMYANVTFEVPSARGILAVPEESVIHSGQRKIVVLDRGGGTFQVREVMLGVNGNGLWEVKEGVAEGDQIVVSSQFLIDSESNLKEAVQKMVASRQSGSSSDVGQPNEAQDVEAEPRR